MGKERNIGLRKPDGEEVAMPAKLVDQLSHGEMFFGNRAADSWSRILGRQAEAMQVMCVRQRWRVDDTIAVVVCGEDFGTNVVEATNVFEFGKQGWRMIHHHGSHPSQQWISAWERPDAAMPGEA